jgi:RHS repeat-associated protein
VVTHPDGGVVSTAYWPTGAVRRVSGARTYPVEYAYDAQGRIKTLTTWQNFAADAGRAVTTWVYDATRGFPVGKLFADNAGPRFSYKPSGRLRSRVWARGGLNTAYEYNAAGDLSAIRYSDQTPAVLTAYDRAGRASSVQDAAGVRTVTYHASGRLQDEGYAGGLFDGLGINRLFDALQRVSGVSARTGATSIVAANLEYDSASRLAGVTSAQISVSYDYPTGSGLVAGMTFRNSGVVRLTAAKAFDRLNRLESVQYTPAVGTPILHAYTANAANQHTRVTREDQTGWSFTHDPLGQLVAGGRRAADGSPIPGYDFSWAYDDIGNRRTASANGAVSSYTASLLNQYTERTVPPFFDVLGAAASGATVTVSVNGGAPQPVARQGELFFKQIPVANASAMQRVPFKLTGVRNLVGTAGEDAVTEIATSAVVPRSPEVFTYDADGNLTADAKWLYSWDAENRLVAMETTPAAVTAGVARLRLEFAYDGGGRRIAKKVLGWNGGAWVTASQRLFLYDGWQLIAELDALAGKAAVRTYVWGTDVGGARGGSGGVGGLLLVSDAAGLAHFFAEDGRGNVTGLVHAVTGAVSARYDYAPFGETVRREGAATVWNPWRFSTRYADEETGLLYFGYRYLDPARGRWISRDPYAESGGLNLYGFVDNAPTEWVDPLGLALYAFDGTNNDGYRDAPERKETNVFVLYGVYEGLKTYAPGVGTNDGLLNPVGMAFGLGGSVRIDGAMQRANQFVIEGDTVADILGFSRGAAQARTFANKLREKFACVKIRWIGLFDTVASEGLPNDVNIGYRLGIPKDTGAVFHLTAGGERRAKTFALTSILPGPGMVATNDAFREVEVPGAVHSDVGGGYETNRGLANTSLLMMWQSGRANGVPFGPLPNQYSDYVGTPHDSRWVNDRIVEFVTGVPRARKIYYHP